MFRAQRARRRDHRRRRQLARRHGRARRPARPLVSRCVACTGPGKLGLSSGVIDGWRFARPESEALGAIDADFSHDPTIVPQMVRALESGRYGLAVGSRYVKGGGITELAAAPQGDVARRVHAGLAADADPRHHERLHPRDGERRSTASSSIRSASRSVSKSPPKRTTAKRSKSRTSSPIASSANRNSTAKRSRTTLRSCGASTRRVSLQADALQPPGYGVTISAASDGPCASAVARDAGRKDGRLMPMPEWLAPAARKASVPVEDAALWVKCPSCGEMLYRKDLAANLSVCAKCQSSFPHVGLRPHQLARRWRFRRNRQRTSYRAIRSAGPIGARISRSSKATRQRSNLSEAVVTGFGTLDAFPVALGVMDFNFRGGTMGTVVGERITDLLEEARSGVCRASSSRPAAARAWKKGMLALMQMAKTTRRGRTLYIGRQSVRHRADRSDDRRRLGLVRLSRRRHHRGSARGDRLRRPARHRADHASAASRKLSDRRISARKRRTSTWSLPRSALRDTLVRLLDYAVDRKRVAPDPQSRARIRAWLGYGAMNVIVEREKGAARGAGGAHRGFARAGATSAGRRRARSRREVSRAAARSVRQSVAVGARQHGAPSQASARGRLSRRASMRFDELHGDRQFRDDPALVGGFAKLRGRRVMVLAQQKGRDTKENIKRNFGMVSPEGYRKATRSDAPGGSRSAFRSSRSSIRRAPIRASRRKSTAQSEAIASALLTLGEGASSRSWRRSSARAARAARSRSRSPTACIMAENAVYSVASPEGCAAILWGDAARAPEAAEHLKLTSADLAAFGIVDEVVPEPLGGAQRDAVAFVERMLDAVDASLGELERLAPADLRERRYQQIPPHRCMGTRRCRRPWRSREAPTAVRGTRRRAHRSRRARVAAVVATVAFSSRASSPRTSPWRARSLSRKRRSTRLTRAQREQYRRRSSACATRTARFPRSTRSCKLVGPHEEIIYVRGLADADAAADERLASRRRDRGARTRHQHAPARRDGAARGRNARRRSGRRICGAIARRTLAGHASRAPLGLVLERRGSPCDRRVSNARARMRAEPSPLPRRPRPAPARRRFRSADERVLEDRRKREALCRPAATRRAPFHPQETASCALRGARTNARRTRQSAWT